ncbi:MAG: hypothetical protein NVS9B6_01980 [Candidatus Limnocylindrales bacterium]
MFPTLFPTILVSRNGFVSLTVNPGATCSGYARYPDNVTFIQLGAQIAPANGMLSWSYQPSPPSSNSGLNHIDCTLNGERASTEAKFLAP